MRLTYRQIVEQAKQKIVEISAEELERRRHPAPVVIDIREADEYSQGTISGSIFIPRGVLESNIGNRVREADTEVVLVCEAGNRSALAALTLQKMGYTNVKSLAGGFARWKAEGRGWAPPQTLSPEQRVRYSRHLLLPDIGENGQQKLLESSVLVVGAGGLGSPAALYMTAAGVGTIGVIDSDVVDASNLQRQILHNVDRIGQLKVESARETLGALNPDVKIETYAVRLSADNAVDLISQYDVVVDGADNFPTRYLINDASLHTRVPVAHGSIFRYEGQATVFVPYSGPCYRCLFAEPPPPDLAPSCSEAGVLGALPGIIGSIQAMEAMKLLLGLGNSLAGRLLTYDALDQNFDSLTIRRNPACPACADPDRPPVLVDYDDACLPAGSTNQR